jgi:uncharacterized membrane protein YsdA (DUF1294 family)
VRDLLISWVAAASAAGLLVMAIDKRAAVRRRWRVPERLLVAIGLLGGTPGLILAMWLLRHKNRKPAWAFGLPLLLALQLWAVGAWMGWW